MRHPSLVSYRARARRRPTFFVSVARPRPPLLSDRISLRMRGGPRRTRPTNGRRVSCVNRHLYTPPTRSAVQDDAPTLRCQAPPRADRPGQAHAQPGAPSTWSAAFRAPVLPVDLFPQGWHIRVVRFERMQKMGDNTPKKQPRFLPRQRRPAGRSESYSALPPGTVASGGRRPTGAAPSAVSGNAAGASYPRLPPPRRELQEFVSRGLTNGEEPVPFTIRETANRSG